MPASPSGFALAVAYRVATQVGREREELRP
jgi:hypothetical protein